MGTRTSRHASTRETCEGTGSLRGIASKTKTTRELNYSQITRETSLKAPGTIMIQPVHKIHVTCLYLILNVTAMPERLVGSPVTCS